MRSGLPTMRLDGSTGSRFLTPSATTRRLTASLPCCAAFFGAAACALLEALGAAAGALDGAALGAGALATLVGGEAARCGSGAGRTVRSLQPPSIAAVRVIAAIQVECVFTGS